MLHRLMITLALAMWTASAAMAADKGGPPAAPAGTVVEHSPFAGLYLEGSAAAANFKAANAGTDSFGLLGLGIGYDHKIAPGIVGGAFARYDFGRDSNTRVLSLGARLGATLNPHLLLYVPVTFSMDGTSPKLDDGIWSAGLGLETALLSHKLSIFGEVTRDFAMQGGARFLDEAYFFRAGLKWRF